MKKIPRQWKIISSLADSEILKFPEIPALVLQLLFNRGITSASEIESFLNPEYTRDVHDPFLFNDMKKVVDRIFLARQNKEKVLVYGDYDADGVSSTALMVSALRTLGMDPGVYIPFREKEGYGMNQKAVEEIVASGMKLIITVDCGIANISEIEFCQKQGVDVIITDHHNPQALLPQAFATINPKRPGEKYPTTEICGTAVAYKVAQALFSDATREQYKNQGGFPAVGSEKWLLDLVAMGTVTDLMELKGESRALLKYGLMVLNKTSRVGLRKLFEVARIELGKIDPYTIGFQIGPRLNAAGRMDHASTSYELLITSDAQEGTKIAQDLNVKNQERQKVSDAMYREAREMVEVQSEETLLTARSSTWNPGLVGLVAGKIMDEFYRPTLLVGKNHEDMWVGSGRSLPGFDITAALGQCQEFLTRFGGHALACGFTLKNEKMFESFCAKMKELARQSLDAKKMAPELAIEIEASLHQLNWEVLEMLEKFEPFGQGNPRPKVLVRGCKVLSCNPVGKNNSHFKGAFGDDQGTLRQAIGFGLGEWCGKLTIGEAVDIVCEPQVNEWNGNREIQLKILDLRKHQEVVK